ncbi:MAG: hypothetical protein WBA68_12900 [Alteraurantiacibacter sp.]
MGQWHDPLGWWTCMERPFRCLSRPLGWAALAMIALAMAWSAVHFLPGEGGWPQAAAGTVELAEDEGDIALYDRILDRVEAGENYYAAALSEQRAGNYPTRPFVTVRLPTLAMLHRWIGRDGVGLLLGGLLILTALCSYLAVAKQAAMGERLGIVVATIFGGAAVAIPQAPLIHELLAGLLLSLALVTYRRERWWPALLLAAAALVVRELAAAFVLLWLAFAAIERRWGEVGALALLLALFALGMGAHYAGVEVYQLPDDAASQGWDAMAGLGLPILALSKLTALLLLPTWLAAALALLPLVGWLALGGRLGLFATFWFAGFSAAIALFARPENFYWAQMMLPAYCAGYAFVPRAIADCLASARGTVRPPTSKQS